MQGCVGGGEGSRVPQLGTAVTSGGRHSALARHVGEVQLLLVGAEPGSAQLGVGHDCFPSRTGKQMRKEEVAAQGHALGYTLGSLAAKTTGLSLIPSQSALCLSRGGN